MPNYKTTLGGFGATSETVSVPSTRTINTTSPLVGGGDLSQDRTFYIDTATLLAGLPTLAGNNVFMGTNYFKGPTFFLGTIGLNSDVQISGTTIAYGPIYQGSISDAQRYTTSGELPRPGGVDRDVQFNDSGVFGGDAALQWNKTNKILVVSGGGIHVKGPILVSGTSFIYGDLDVNLLDLHQSRLLMHPSEKTVEFVSTHGSDVQPVLSVGRFANAATTPYGAMQVRRGRGTYAQASGLQLGDIVGEFSFLGRTQTGFSGAKAGMFGVAKEEWSLGTQGGYLSFRTTTSGQDTMTERLRLDQDATLFAPLYAGSVATAARYVTSGELTAGAVGGSDQQIQFNDAGAAAGDSALTWQKTPNILTVSGESHLYGPAYQGGGTGGAARYVTSGELTTAAPGGSGVAQTDNVYWTGSTHVFSQGTTVTFSGEVRLAGGTNGSFLSVLSSETSVTLSGFDTAYVDDFLSGPVIGLAARNVTAISGGGAGFKGIYFGVSGQNAWRGLFASAVGGGSGNTITYVNWGLGQVPVFGTAADLQIYCSGGPKFAGGTMRLTRYYLALTAPTG